jgi:hypothetical protein
MFLRVLGGVQYHIYAMTSTMSCHQFLHVVVQTIDIIVTMVVYGSKLQRQFSTPPHYEFKQAGTSTSGYIAGKGAYTNQPNSSICVNK